MNKRDMLVEVHRLLCLQTGKLAHLLEVRTGLSRKTVLEIQQVLVSAQELMARVAS